MRKLTPIGLLLLAHAAGAQSWCPPGATWMYDTGNPWFDGETQLIYTGDTMVDGHMAQRIERTRRVVIQGNLNVSGPVAGFTRTDGDVVWEWNGTAWDTLYWFSAVPGDHWQPFWPFEEDCPDHAWHVTDTTTVTISGVPLRRVFVELRESGVPAGVNSTFTERIGGGGGFLFPGLPPCGAIYECYCTFSCYRDDEVNANSACALTLSVPSLITQETRFQAHPNPGTTFQLTGLGQRPALLRVLDVQGRIVHEGIPATEHAPVDLGELHPGTYLVEVQLADGRRQVLRWVRE